MNRVQIIISGFVQGVGFRHFVRAKARELGLAGWVKNLPAQAGTENGMVEVLVEGEKEKLEKLIKLCKEGPMLSEVKDVSIEWQKETGKFNEFEIK